MLLLVGLGHAFCGTYVGPVDAPLVNRASQVVMTRVGEETILTLAADLTADVPTFGLVIPVPEVLGEEDVTLADVALFTSLERYSAPRIVSYTCEDLHPVQETDADSDADTDTTGTDTATGVTVEVEFSLGSYDIAVLTATGSEGLVDWLAANGFVVTEEAAPVLQEYIDAGQHFVAAKVDLEETPSAGTWLEPLQLRYTDPAFVLPIRIGTTASDGSQDVLVYVLAETRAAVANYAEANVEDDCLLPEGVTDVGAFYADQLTAAFGDDRNWMTEYAWSSTGCDPCASEPPDPATLELAGWTQGEAPFVTRLRLRYTPEQATQDVVLYETGTQSFDQVKYVVYAHALESDIPTCGVGFPEDPGSCPDGGTPDGDDSGDAHGDGSGDGSGDGCGCASTPGVASGVGLGALGLALRRRRTRSEPTRA